MYNRSFKCYARNITNLLGGDSKMQSRAPLGINLVDIQLARQFCHLRNEHSTLLSTNALRLLKHN